MELSDQAVVDRGGGLLAPGWPPGRRWWRLLGPPQGGQGPIGPSRRLQAAALLGHLVGAGPQGVAAGHQCPALLPEPGLLLGGPGPGHEVLGLPLGLPAAVASRAPGLGQLGRPPVEQGLVDGIGRPAEQPPR